MNGARLPVAPQLSTDGNLDVFIHRSAAPANVPLVGQHGGGPRLNVLGASMLVAVYSAIVHAHYPQMTGDQINQHVQLNIQPSVVRWVDAYGWLNYVRGANGVDLNNPHEKRILFERYVGAVFREHQWEGLYRWIDSLMYPARQAQA
ncbi:uncharacterized protein BXZ73DRAFT_99023 [Epithele typhae]|uniref:uncharacterized protein n=1 Tax=Epithele typhae TaxID=378194 RepID=UPI0020084030|nr:uncharacterized protein BXZ73DRAFT_99023 [Epithele typhae]KAH9940028.1 hypothetical protein BXZ73DRAFT_99023 [Epithele typhae]